VASSASIAALRACALSRRLRRPCNWPASSDTPRCAKVQRALRVLAQLLGLEQAILQSAQGFVAARLGLRQRLDLGAQLLDLGFARERTLLSFAAAQHAQPAGAQPLAAAGDGGLAFAQRRQQRLRRGGVLDRAHRHEQGAQCGRAAHVRGQRTGGSGEIAGGGIEQRDAALRQSGQRGKLRRRILDQHGLEQAAEHGLDRALPAGIHFEGFAQAGIAGEFVRAQPVKRDVLFLAERGVLQGFERGQAAARGLAPACASPTARPGAGAGVPARRRAGLLGFQRFGQPSRPALPRSCSACASASCACSAAVSRVCFSRIAPRDGATARCPCFSRYSILVRSTSAQREDSACATA
jgi:hypothetical protein